MAIFTSIATAIAGALFGGSALAASLIGGALAFGAKLAIGKLGQQKQQKRKYAAVQGEIQFGGDVSVSALYGVGKTKGQRTFYAKWGSGNKWNAEVFVLANGWCDGLEPYVYIYGEKKDLVSRPVIGNEVANYHIEGFVNGSGDPVLTIRFYDGRPGQLVDQKLVDVTAGLGNKWKSTSINAGICYVVVERIYSDKLFGSKGRPELEFALRGLREYDPRKDSTVAGGSGPQRLNTPSTWVHTKNPAVHRLNYQLGLRALISGRTLIGEGKSLGQIDLATYFVAMNVCDTLRANGKKTYECSLFVSGDDDHTEVLKQFDDAMAGYGLNRRGLSGVIPGAPQIPVKDLTAADIPIDRAKDVQFRPSAFERFNHLSGQFTSIESMWNPESLKPVYVNADIAADGRNRQTSVDFLQVTDPDIAQYLLNIRYRQNRMGGKATVPVSRRFGLAVQEGEWITWRGKSWLISEWRADERLRITLVLSETSAAIYDDAGIQPGPIVIPPTPPINPSLLSTVQNFNVAVGMINGAQGYDTPALVFTWTPPDDPTITAVRFSYQIEGTTELFEDQCTSPEDGLFRTTKNVVSGKVYNARATITTVPDRLRTFTPWATTAQPTGLQTLLTGLQQLQDDALNRFKELQQEMDEFFRPRLVELLDAFSLEGAVGQIERQQIVASIGDALAQITEERRVRVSENEATAQLLKYLQASLGGTNARLITEETVRATADSALSSQITQLTAETGSNAAAIQAEATARADADSALSSSITSLDAEVDGNLARLIQEETARANGDSANATSINGVSADFNGRFAQGLVKFEAVAAPAGVDARFSVLLRAGTSQSFKVSGFYVELYTEGGVQKSRMAVQADQFLVTSGNNRHYPLVFENGELKLAIANIGTVHAGLLQSLNGKMKIDLNNGTIEIFS
ncbi:phage tail protein [Sinorhizobium meliloti]|uniref:phage tail protein n=2 Tax=Rhizobium meliloti TaxID=382 RepID=UPI000FD53383|nr:phage tail protein [Sinorhizobium meliloti]RVK09268.1 phage tail protein [Sinorhizobium meliloti]RVL61207.1 phage tail protein [Sinorhizobium meliloti]RVL63905.1 phage tail protein [Sinorhizobium meliloti]RVL85655.1 phage tail protein [Sinorhizobium meliloti]RVP49946.1 phage tail protein [Sinorhizobium meliloti]